MVYVKMSEFIFVQCRVTEAVVLPDKTEPEGSVFLDAVISCVSQDFANEIRRRAERYQHSVTDIAQNKRTNYIFKSKK